jgi:hypothetical protein
VTVAPMPIIGKAQEKTSVFRTERRRNAVKPK